MAEDAGNRWEWGTERVTHARVQSDVAGDTGWGWGRGKPHACTWKLSRIACSTTGGRQRAPRVVVEGSNGSHRE